MIRRIPGCLLTTIHAQSVDEPPSVMVSSGGLEFALVYAGRLMCFL
jgi:hypothetical protein